MTRFAARRPRRGTPHRLFAVLSHGPAAAATLVALACAPDIGEGNPTEPAEWPVSDEPTLGIGVVEGDSMFQFFGAQSAVRFDDGAVLVANAGTGELRFFDGRGRFVWRAGGRGGGPSEFRWLARIYRYGDDSVLAYDQTGRMSVFDRRGNFARSYQIEPAGGNPFPLDAWLYLKNWVEGPLDTAARARVNRALGRLPPLPPDGTFRFVRIDDEGLLWARPPIGSAASPQRWTVFDTTGAAVAAVSTPLRFDVLQIGRDYILGRWRNAEDVEFIHVYALTRAATTPVGTAPSAPAAPDSLETIDTAEFLRRFRGALRQLVTAQELNYAEHGTYTQNLADLAFVAEDITLDILTADSRGWAGVGSHPQFALICAMAIGSGVPPGWPEGIPACAEGMDGTVIQ